MNTRKNRTCIYTKKELTQFNNWRTKQRKYYTHMKIFNNIYKPWKDNMLSYGDRYKIFLKNYKNYDDTKRAVSKQLISLLFDKKQTNYINKDTDIESELYSTIKSHGFYPNDDYRTYKTYSTITCQTETNNMIISRSNSIDDNNSVKDNDISDRGDRGDGKRNSSSSNSSNSSSITSDNSIDEMDTRVEYNSDYNSEYNSDYETPYHSGYESEEDNNDY